MSLLDGLKDSMKNPLAENNEDMEFVLESDFDLALEKATDVRLSPEDIRAILNGDDDIPDDEDDLDDPDDDIGKDYTSELEACKEALEATMTELGIDTAGDELSEDDDTDDLELDPEGDDEIISEEQLIAQIESISNNNDEQVDLMAQLESLLPDEDDEPPADDSAMESPDYLIGKDKNIHVHSISESDDEDDDEDEEHESKHHEHEEHESEEEEEEEHRNHEDDDEDEEDEHDHKHDEDDEDEDDEDEDEGSLESILDNLLSM